MNVGTKILYKGRHPSSWMEGKESRKTTIRTKASMSWYWKPWGQIWWGSNTCRRTICPGVRSLVLWYWKPKEGIWRAVAKCNVKFYFVHRQTFPAQEWTYVHIRTNICLICKCTETLAVIPNIWLFMQIFCLIWVNFGKIYVYLHTRNILYKTNDGQFSKLKSVLITWQMYVRRICTKRYMFLHWWRAEKVVKQQFVLMPEIVLNWPFPPSFFGFWILLMLSWLFTYIMNGIK